MQNALKTIEKGNLYASFGLVEDLSDDELMDIEGGGDRECAIYIQFCNCQSKSGDSNKGHGSENNGSSNNTRGSGASGFHSASYSHGARYSGS